MDGAKRAKQKRLGRGLESLLGPIMSTSLEEAVDGVGGSIGPNLPPDKELHESLRHLEIGSIVANPYQPRRSWDDDDLAALADSIKTNGLVQPILVRPAGAKYEVIAGERRLRAAQLAGMESIVALVREANDAEMLELALVENIHRRDLNAIERAEAYMMYLNRFSLTQAEVAERLGEDRSVVANYLRLLDLPEDMKQMVVDRRLSMGHARAILGLETDELRRKLANRALAGRLSVREVERLVRKHLGRDRTGKKERAGKAPYIIDLEQRLSGKLGTSVAIEVRRRGQGGKIVIEFCSLEEFERITERMGMEALEEV